MSIECWPATKCLLLKRKGKNIGQFRSEYAKLVMQNFRGEKFYQSTIQSYKKLFLD